MKLIPVILCGGAGTRLWPVSRQSFPKPFMKIGGKTLLEHAVVRGQACGTEDLVIVANESHLFQIQELLNSMEGEPKANYLLEPRGRNTAPAVALAAFNIAERYGRDAVMLVLSADHLIPETNSFVANVLEAASYAQEDQLVVFGVVPTSPETGYGYIEVGDMSLRPQPVVEFVEKPNEQKAIQYLGTGRHYWNSGMFCFTVGAYLDALQLHAGHVFEASYNVAHNPRSTELYKANCSISRFDELVFGLQPDISIDYAVMEKAQNVTMVPAKFSWSDVGSWSSVSDASMADSNGNTIVGDKKIDWISIDTTNTHVHAESQGSKAVIATLGISDLIIVHTPDAVLVAEKTRSQEVKKIVSHLKEYDIHTEQHQTTLLPHTVRRPWGTYTSLKKEEPGYQVKRITVSPGQRLSLQYHHHRAEHWTVVRGRATVEVDGMEFELGPGEHKFIPLGAKHRLTNWGDIEMVLIEVQIGDYLGEDDIVRLEDVYGRE